MCEAYEMSSHYLLSQSPLSVSLTADHLTSPFAAATQFKLMFCGTGPHVALFTNGCINSVSCIWIMKAAAAGPLRARDKRPCLPFSPTPLFLFLSSQQLRSHGSHTLKPHAFNHAHEVRECYNGSHQFPGVYTAKSCSCCCAGQGGLCVN